MHNKGVSLEVPQAADPQTAPETDGRLSAVDYADEPEPQSTVQDLDPLTLYIREAGKAPLFTPEEELSFAARKDAGDEAAKQEMINRNLRLVISIARHYQGHGLPLLDLIEEGNIGLMRAVESFDHTTGFKLSTYASKAIARNIQKAIADQSRTIKLPVEVGKKISSINKTKRQLAQKLGHEPQLAELAEETAIPETQLAELLRYNEALTSLDELADKDESASHSTTNYSETPELMVMKKAGTIALVEAIDTLPPRFKRAITLRYGLDGEKAKTVEQVAAELGTSYWRVRQILKKARTDLHNNLRRDKVTRDDLRDIYGIDVLRSGEI